MAESSLKGQKTLWKKEKLLVMSNFSFFHSVFRRLALQTRKNQGLFGKGLTDLSSLMSKIIPKPLTAEYEIFTASTLCQTTKLYTGPIRNHLQTTKFMLLKN